MRWIHTIIAINYRIDVENINTFSDQLKLINYEEEKVNLKSTNLLISLTIKYWLPIKIYLNIDIINIYITLVYCQNFKMFWSRRCILVFRNLYQLDRLYY